MTENTPEQICAIFYVSDGTGITAETVGQSLITQFPKHIKFVQKRIPFVDTEVKAEQAADMIRQARADFQPLVINTVVDINLRKIIHAAGGLKLDPFNQMGSPMELIEAFGGKDKYEEAIQRIEEDLYGTAS